MKSGELMVTISIREGDGRTETHSLGQPFDDFGDGIDLWRGLGDAIAQCLRAMDTCGSELILAKAIHMVAYKVDSGEKIERSKSIQALFAAAKRVDVAFGLTPGITE